MPNISHIFLIFKMSESELLILLFFSKLCHHCSYFNSTSSSFSKEPFLQHEQMYRLTVFYGIYICQMNDVINGLCNLNVLNFAAFFFFITVSMMFETICDRLTSDTAHPQIQHAGFYNALNIYKYFHFSWYFSYSFSLTYGKHFVINLFQLIFFPLLFLS